MWNSFVVKECPELMGHTSDVELLYGKGMARTNTKIWQQLVPKEKLGRCEYL